MRSGLFSFSFVVLWLPCLIFNFYGVCSVPWWNRNLALAEKCSGPLRFRLRQVLLYLLVYHRFKTVAITFVLYETKPHYTETSYKVEMSVSMKTGSLGQSSLCFPMLVFCITKSVKKWCAVSLPLVWTAWNWWITEHLWSSVRHRKWPVGEQIQEPPFDTFP